MPGITQTTDSAPLAPQPAGWYFDGSRTDVLRWWDGREWTSHISPVPDSGARRRALAGLPTGRGPGRRGKIAAWVGGGVAFLLLMGALNGEPSSAGVAEPSATSSVSAPATGSPTTTPTPSPSTAAPISPSASPTESATTAAAPPWGDDQNMDAPDVTTRAVVLRYSTVTRKDSSLAKGKTKVVRNGVNGKRIDTYSDGTKVSSKVVRKPVSRILTVGTRTKRVSKPRNVYYRNCAAARAAGAAPVVIGQPGYGRHLDRDGDGRGCE